ncbi:hypothetical protein NDU88_004881 [Pleurodeles waltl]|uniref:Uncharacterized protein n=1 Tax=Pleurodeles waltl TaxID=8319 RepID=A0AAV7LLB1_PLEWA|nr:hypothetical protein NDU88_004881 [Pleurodeles waltl]
MQCYLPVWLQPNRPRSASRTQLNKKNTFPDTLFLKQDDLPDIEENDGAADFIQMVLHDLCPKALILLEVKEASDEDQSIIRAKESLAQG